MPSGVILTIQGQAPSTFDTRFKHGEIAHGLKPGAIKITPLWGYIDNPGTGPEHF